MSSRLSASGGWHDVDVDKSSCELVGAAQTRFELDVDWPHMWRTGHAVTIRTTDGHKYTGEVLSVSESTKKVLIELV